MFDLLRWQFLWFLNIFVSFYTGVYTLLMFNQLCITTMLVVYANEQQQKFAKWHITCHLEDFRTVATTDCCSTLGLLVKLPLYCDQTVWINYKFLWLHCISNSESCHHIVSVLWKLRLKKLNIIQWNRAVLIKYESWCWSLSISHLNVFVTSLFPVSKRTLSKKQALSGRVYWASAA